MDIIPTIPRAPQVPTPAAGEPERTDGTAGFATLFEKAAANLTTAEHKSTAAVAASTLPDLPANAANSEPVDREAVSQEEADAADGDAQSPALPVASILIRTVVSDQTADAGVAASAATATSGDTGCSLSGGGELRGKLSCPPDPARPTLNERAGRSVDDVAGDLLRTQPTSPGSTDPGEMHLLHGAVETVEGSGVQKVGPQPDEPARPGMQPMHPEPSEKHASLRAQNAHPLPSAGENHADMHEGMPNAHKEAADGRRESTGEPSAIERRLPEAPADRQFSHLPLQQTGARPEPAPEQTAVQAVVHHDRQHAPVSTAAVEAPALRQTVEPKFHLVRRDEQTFEVHVEPEGLGMLDIRIVLDRGTVSAHIIAAEDRVRDFMGQHLDSLASALAAEGVKVGDLSVGGRGRDRGAMQEENGRRTPDRRQDDTVLRNRTRDAGSGISIFV